MNYTYIITMYIVMAHGILQIYTGSLDYTSSSLRQFITLLSLIVGSLMFVVSLAFPFGSSSSLTKEATNTRIGNEIIIQAEGMPTQIVTDIKYIDRKVQVVETTNRAVWGWETPKTYKLKIVD